MAEFVQQSVERMLPELEQMSRVGLFSDEETRTIIKKRTAYEYKLRRQNKQKADFLQYIQYEINLLALVRKRRQKTGYNFKKVEIDTTIMQRIHKLFKTICFRFQEDSKLWLSHIEFCKNIRDTTMVSRLFTRMLQVQNHKADLWILAAKWEMEDGLSMENSRRLLQRGIRFNPASRILWTEYFRMELLNAEKLRKRRELLGVTGDNMEVDGEEMSEPILEGRVAEVVYNKALETFPDVVEVVLSFLAVAQLFDFTDWLQEKIYKDLEEKFSDQERMWDALAYRCLKQAQKRANVLFHGPAKKEMKKADAQCMSIYERGLEKLNTERMWTLYLEFCLERIQLCPIVNTKKKLAAKILRLFERASEERKLKEKNFIDWIGMLLDMGLVQQLEHALRIGVERYPASVQLWKHKLSHLVTEQADIDTVKADLDKASLAVPPKMLLHLWILVIEYCIIQHPDYVTTLFKSGENGVCTQVSLLVKERHIEWMGLQHGIAAVRKLYNRLSKTSPLSPKFFRNYIELEKAQVNPKMKRIRDAYEDSLRLFGNNNPDVWMDYAMLELDHPKGRPQAAGKLHWRAVKALEAPHSEHFVRRYSRLNNTADTDEETSELV